MTTDREAIEKQIYKIVQSVHSVIKDDFYWTHKGTFVWEIFKMKDRLLRKTLGEIRDNPKDWDDHTPLDQSFVGMVIQAVEIKHLLESDIKISPITFMEKMRELGVQCINDSRNDKKTALVKWVYDEHKVLKAMIKDYCTNRS